MDPKQKECLQLCHLKLIGSVDPRDRIADQLFQNGILTDMEKSECLRPNNADSRIRTLLDILPRKGAGAWDAFVSALKNSQSSSHQEEAARLVTTLEKILYGSIDGTDGRAGNGEDVADSNAAGGGGSGGSGGGGCVSKYLGKLWQEVGDIPLSNIAKDVRLGHTNKANFANRLGTALAEDEIQESVREHIRQKRDSSFIFLTSGDGVDNLHGTLHWAREQSSTTLTVGQVLGMLQGVQPARASKFASTFREHLQ